MQPGGDPLVLCFVDFLSPAHAATAMDALQGEIMMHFHCGVLDPSGGRFCKLLTIITFFIHYVLVFVAVTNRTLHKIDIIIETYISFRLVMLHVMMDNKILCHMKPRL